MQTVSKSYSLYLLREYGEINCDFKHFALSNQKSINALRDSGYEFYISNGPLVQIITYSQKGNFSQTTEQRVYRNEYFMLRGEDTRIKLCDGLAYRGKLSWEELQEGYVIKSIVDLGARLKSKSKSESPVDYLASRYIATEPQFVEYMLRYREQFDEYLADMYSKGYRLKVSLEKSQEMHVFRLKEQYKGFAQHQKRLNVIINGKLVTLPLQLIATQCQKVYELYDMEHKDTIKPVVLYATSGFASVYDLYLRDYYHLVV